MASLPSPADEGLIRAKQDQAIRFLEDQDLDAWLIFVREGSDADTTALISGSGYIVQNAAFVITRDGRRIAVLQPIDIQNKAGLFFDNIVPAGSDIDGSIARILADIDPRRLALNFSRTEFCADGLTHGMYLRLIDLLTGVDLHERVVSAEDLVVQLRAVKVPDEIARIRKAAEITADLADAAKEIMKPGIQDVDVFDFFMQNAARFGAEGIVASVSANPIGENDKGLKGRPLQAGDLIISDMGAKYHGYNADLKRCWYVLKTGETDVPNVLADQWQACIDTLDYSVRELRAGRPGYEVHDAVWEYMEQTGYTRDGHSYGHQIGRSIHDAGPWLGERDNIYRPATALLRENMVITLDPTINRVGIANPGCFSMGVEEMGIVGTDGGALVQPAQREIFLIRF